MRTKLGLGGLAAAVLFLAAVPARADDATAVRDRVVTALKGVQSYQMAIAGPAGMAGTTTFVKPMRSHTLMTVGPMTMESIFVDRTIYMRMNGGAWQTRTVPDAQQAQLKTQIEGMAADAVVTPLPDRNENGTTVGAYQYTMPLPLPTSETSVKPGPPSTLICTYDKTTNLPRTCSMTMPQTAMTMTMTYSHWNDPANAVDVPADAK